MSEFPLLPSPRTNKAVRASLLDLTEERVLSPARRAGYELRLVGATVLPQRQVIAQTQWGKWLFVNHAEDPTAMGYGGKIPVPAEHLDKLVRIDRAGAHLDHVWLGHQLADIWQEGDAVPVPTPRELREKDERLQLHIARAAKLYLRGAGALVTAAAAAPLAFGGGLASLGAGFDPIVLGGVQHPDYPVVQWVLLAQWEWE
jgi:hypothetical protein